MPNLDYGSSLTGLLISALFLARLLTLLKHKSDPIKCFLTSKTSHLTQSKIQCHNMIYEALDNLQATPNALPLTVH